VIHAAAVASENDSKVAKVVRSHGGYFVGVARRIAFLSLSLNLSAIASAAAFVCCALLNACPSLKTHQLPRWFFSTV